MKKCIQRYHTIKNPNFFDVDEKLNDYVTNHKKQVDLYLVKGESELAFTNFATHFKTEFQDKTSNNYMKRSLIFSVESFVSRGYIFFVF